MEAQYSLIQESMEITDLYSGISGLDFVIGYGVGKESLKNYGPGGSNQLGNGRNPNPKPGKSKVARCKTTWRTHGSADVGLASSA
jgi:hypothetical protein